MCGGMSDTIRRLPKNDAQTLIDVIDEARCSLRSFIHWY